jgi:hypothetical protein
MLVLAEVHSGDEHICVKVAVRIPHSSTAGIPVGNSSPGVRWYFVNAPGIRLSIWAVMELRVDMAGLK